MPTTRNNTRQHTKPETIPGRSESRSNAGGRRTPYVENNKLRPDDLPADGREPVLRRGDPARPCARDASARRPKSGPPVAARGDCPSRDTDGDDSLAINELIAAVHAEAKHIIARAARAKWPETDAVINLSFRCNETQRSLVRGDHCSVDGVAIAFAPNREEATE